MRSRVLARLDFELKRKWNGDWARTFSTGWVGGGVLRHPLVSQADIVHLHWVNNGFVSNATIGRLRKPVVWTLHDMWPFTGGCHVSSGCQRYRERCGRCPIFGGRRDRDRTRRIFDQKSRLWRKVSQLLPVGVSPWIADAATRSPIFHDREVRWIWNGIDLNRFPLVDQDEARSELGLEPGLRYFAVGAWDLDAPHKGTAILESALEKLKEGPDQDLLRLLLFGRGGEALVRKFPGSKHFGVVRDEALLNRIYGAADLYATGSLQESFGQTIAESLASGTPVVCFDNSGPRHIVAHQETGYLAKAHSVDDLTTGIQWTLDATRAKERRRAIRKACHQSAKRFCHLHAAREYLELYRSMSRR